MEPSYPKDWRYALNHLKDLIIGDVSKGEFEQCMQREFEISLMGELNYFLGLQIKQMRDGIFICQAKYSKELIKKFGLEDSKNLQHSHGHHH